MSPFRSARLVPFVLALVLAMVLAGCRSSTAEPTAPNPPTDVTPVASSGRIDVTWTPPTDDGAGALDGYDVERAGADGATWVASATVGGEAVAASLTDLTNYDAYRVRVAARRDGLRSAWVEPDVTLVPRPDASVGPPDAPTTPPSPGDAFVVVGGDDVPVNVSSGDAALRLEAGPSGTVVLHAPIALDEGRAVPVLAPGGDVDVELVGGVAPGSHAVLELRSTPRTWATFPVSPSGRIRYTATVPTDLAPGAHTLRVRGRDAAGRDVRFSVGVRVADAPAAVVNVAISPSTVSLVEATTAPLEVEVTAVGGAPVTVSWTSADPSVATVDGDGRVTGVAPGATRVTARSTFAPSVTDTVAVSVTETPVVTAVTLTETQLVLVPGTARTPTWDVATEGGAETTVTWRTSDPSVARVDADGRITARAPGRTTVVATSAVDPTRSDVVAVVVALPRTVAAGYYQTFALDAQGRGWSWGNFAEGALGHGAMPDPTVAAAEPMDMSAVAGGRFAAIDGGLNVAVARTPGGRLYAWGSNGSGALGIGRTFGEREKATAPLAVDAPSDVRFVQVDVGEDHAVALDDQGRAWAWGANAGQLGTGDTTFRTRPTRVKMGPLPDGVTFARVAAGANHSAAIDTDGAVWTWGANGASGALGDGGVVTYRDLPVRVDPAAFLGAPRFVDVAAGYEVTWVLADDGRLWAWGDDASGELGDGPPQNDRAVPGPVDLSALEAAGRTARHLVGGGSHAFVVDDQGDVWAWGSDASNQLGTASTTDATTPVAVAVPSGVDVVALAADDHHAVLLDAAHRAWSWGGGTEGELGIGVTATDAATPQPVRTVVTPTFTEIAAGIATAAALDDAGRTWVWGEAIDGMDHPTDRPVLVDTTGRPSDTAFVDLSVGDVHVLALDEQGHLWAWGGNGSGQLGVGTTTPSDVPLPVDAPSGVTFRRISAGESFSVALAEDGTVWSWGRNVAGALGHGTSGSDALVPSPTDPGSAMGHVVDVAAGDAHALALDDQGDLWAWGSQSGGPMGTAASSASPVPVSMTDFAPGTADALATGRKHTLAADADGRVWAWGDNLSRQLGEFAGVIGASEFPISATDDFEESGDLRLAAGDDASYVLTAAGTVESWGADDRGQLGENAEDANDSPTPAPVALDGTRTYVQLVAGADFTFARSADGVVYAWGDHDDGQLGVGPLDGGATFADIPVAVGESAPVVWSPVTIR